MKSLLFALAVIAILSTIAASPRPFAPSNPHTFTASSISHPLSRPISPSAPRTVFFDDFNTGQLDRSKWNVVVTGFHVNNEQQAYVDSANTLFEENGQLVLQPCYTPGFVTRDGQHFDFISARINTRDKFDFLYGRAEARIRIDSGAGLWPAWWMLGYGRWPACGEQDIMEFVGDHDWASSAVHGPKYFGNTPFVKRYYFPHGADITQWHVYTVAWTPDSLNFIFDGVPTYSVTRQMAEHYGPWAFDKREFLILNFALGGAYPATVNRVREPYSGLPESTVGLIKAHKARMYVDWVKVTQE
jgi:beta-glucanase (GH16 family)